MATTNSRLDLVKLGYDELRQSLRNLMATKTPFWENPHPADPNVVLIDLMATLGDMFHFYLEQRTNEMILTRSQRKKSVIDLGKVWDYHLSRPHTTAYRLYLRSKVGIPNTVSTVQTLPIGTQFRSNKNSYYIKEPIGGDFSQINPTTNIKGIEVEVFEGVLHQESFSLLPLSLGQKIYEIPLQYPDIAQNFFSLTVDGEIWEEETFSPSISFNKKKFIVETDEDGYSKIVFNGYKYDLPQELNPSSSLKVGVNYVSTTGIEGQLSDATEITTLDLPSDVNFDFSPYFEVNPNTVTLTASFIPEADWREAKRKVSSMFSTLWRAVSLNDYEKLTLTRSEIQSVRATRKDLYVVGDENRHVAQVWVKPYGNAPYPIDLLDDIQDFLEDRSCVGADVEVAMAPVKPFYLSIEVLRLSRTPEIQLRSDIAQVAQQLSSDLEVGETLTVDKVYDTLGSVFGVLSIKINRMSFAIDSNISHLKPLTKEILKLQAISVSISVVADSS